MADSGSDGTLDYRWIKELGRGSFGTVHLVENKHSRRMCAIKFVDNDETKPANYLAGVLPETELQQRASVSEFVLQVVTWKLVTDRFVFIIMEVAAQGELEGRLSGEARQSMDESDIWEWIRQLSRGLYDIHEQMIAHCDLKPQNILLAAPGSKIKIADFGLALKLRRGRRSFSKRGTPSYMAPEVHALPDRDSNKGEKSQDVNPDKGGSNSAADVPVSNGFSFNADVWSLGVIICRFCTPNGRLPNFSGAEN